MDDDESSGPDAANGSGDDYVPDEEDEVQEDDPLESTSLGLSRVLASAGVDTSTLSRFLPASSTQQGFHDIDAESDNEDKYEDDVSEHELAPESSADAARRDQEQRDQERWVRRAMEMQAQVGKAVEGAAEKKARQRQREWEEIKRVWPAYEKGKRLKMSEVFYETPQMRQEWANELKRAKRRRLEPREGRCGLMLRAGLADSSSARHGRAGPAAKSADQLARGASAAIAGFFSSASPVRPTAG